MKTPSPVSLTLSLCLLFLPGCTGSSGNQAGAFSGEPNSVLSRTEPENRVRTLFQFHSQLLEEISKSASYKDLVDKDEWANSVQEAISLEINEGDWTFDQWADLNRRLRAAEAEEDIRYVDRFLLLRETVDGQIALIRSTVETIDRSMNLWEEPESITAKRDEILICLSELVGMKPDADGLGLSTSFSACSRSAQAGVQRALVLGTRGPEIRAALRRNRPQP